MVHSVEVLGTVAVCGPPVTDTLLHSAGLCFLKSLETCLVDTLRSSDLGTFTITHSSEVSCHRHPFSAVFQEENSNIRWHVYASLKLLLPQKWSIRSCYYVIVDEIVCQRSYSNCIMTRGFCSVLFK